MANDTTIGLYNKTQYGHWEPTPDGLTQQYRLIHHLKSFAHAPGAYSMRMALMMWLRGILHRGVGLVIMCPHGDMEAVAPVPTPSKSWSTPPNADEEGR